MKTKSLKILLIISVFISVCTISAFADNDDFIPGTWANPTDLTMQVFSSAWTPYNSNLGKYYLWNGIDSGVNIDSSDYYADDRELNRYIRAYGKELTGATMGLQEHYKMVLFWYELTPPSYTGTWAKAHIYMDTRTTGLLDKSDNIKTNCALHEIGHCLALSHPDPDVQDCVMHYTVQDVTTPQPHDQSNLQAKW